MITSADSLIFFHPYLVPFLFQRCRSHVARFPLQERDERHLGRRNGPWENRANDLLFGISHRERYWRSFPHRRASLDPEQLEGGIRQVG